MKQLIKIFQQAKGAEVLRQYIRSHVFLRALLLTSILGPSKKGLEIMRSGVQYKLLKKLERKNSAFINQFVQNQNDKPSSRHDKVIWMGWLQGIEQAPDMVQRCVANTKRKMEALGYQVILISEQNLKEYVTLPSFIEQKYKQGIIPPAHYADLIRLNLLIEYGGTWIDTTVYCSQETIPSYMLESDLFVFQELKPGKDGHSLTTSNWFITSSAQHPILMLTRALLLEYWKSHNKLIDYYIYHYYFEIARKQYVELDSQIVPCSNGTPHILLLHLFEKKSYAWFESILSQSPWHKLTYKLDSESQDLQGTCFEYLMERMSQDGIK